MKLIRKNEVINTSDIDFINELKSQGFIEVIEEETQVEEVKTVKAKAKSKG